MGGCGKADEHSASSINYLKIQNEMLDLDTSTFFTVAMKT